MDRFTVFDRLISDPDTVGSLIDGSESQEYDGAQSNKIINSFMDKYFIVFIFKIKRTFNR